MPSRKESLAQRILQARNKNPFASNRKLADVVGCDHKTVGRHISAWRSQKVKPGKSIPHGRPKKLSSEVRAAALLEAVSQHSANSADVAGSLKQRFGVNVHPSTVRRTLKEEAVVCGYAQNIPMLSNPHLTKRVKWCRKKKRARSSFAGTMFTDSKVFLLNRLSSKRGPQIYYQKGSRPKVPTVRHSKGLHVYLGVTKFGITKPIFVTGGGSKASKYKHPKTKQTLTGVGAEEYWTDVLPSLISDGNSLFKKSAYWAKRWIFQQDNAPPHTAVATKAKLVDLMGGVESRVELDWPPMSPDLSWIENIWSLAERELAKQRSGVKTIPELEKAVKEILKGIKIEVLEELVKSMPARLDKVIAGGGHPIDF